MVLNDDSRVDGAVAALVAPDRTETRRMVSVGLPAGTVIEVVDLPDGTAGVDLDAAAGNLLLLTARAGS